MTTREAGDGERESFGLKIILAEGDLFEIDLHDPSVRQTGRHPIDGQLEPDTQPLNLLAALAVPSDPIWDQAALPE